MSLEEYAERVLDLVARIPPGTVVAYGDVSRMLGEGGPRNVGAVMSRHGGGDVPWWRVIRADGRPPVCDEAGAIERWRAEGTPMVGGPLSGSRADMTRARWAAARPEEKATYAAHPAERHTSPPRRGAVHHLEIRVADLAAAGREWGWLLGRLGYRLGDDWGHGQAWEGDGMYVVLESGPELGSGRCEPRRPGVHHLALAAGSPADVDALVADCRVAGWSVLPGDRHPHAAVPGHHVAHLVSSEGVEVELVGT